MPILEDQLNGRIATLLGRMSPHWNALGENKGAFQGSQRQPDILVVQQGGQPVVIENEYFPAHNVEEEALQPLGEILDAGVVGASGRIDAAVALRSPQDLRSCGGLDEVDDLLSGGAILDYALLSGGQPPDVTRFPERGFIRGSLRDLAAFLRHAAVPQSAVERAVSILEHGIEDAGAILGQAAELRSDTKDVVVEQLKHEYGSQTLRMAATIMINALVFQQNLAGQYGVRNLEQIKSNGVLTQSAVLDEWRKVLGVNYWSIFSIASDILRGVNPPSFAVDMLEVMSDTAVKLDALGVSQSHDLSGTVFQKLIADRKFLATFYTRPESAALLAHLAVPDDGGWGDAERVKEFSVADYACGTGTLIHAAYRRINQLHQLAGGDPESLHAHMMKNRLTACDVLPSAVHLTASMLSSSHPRRRYTDTRTIVVEYGKTETGGVSLGSLDLLNGRTAIRPLIPLNTTTVVGGSGQKRASLDVDMPHASQDLVIMNPPFTRAGSDWQEGNPDGYSTKTFHGLSTDTKTQKRMAELAKEYAKGTCAHGYAGIGSWFAALANRMVRKGGTIALVLPMTALQGATWNKVREQIRRNYRGVTIMTIAAAHSNGQSFSADTSMAETMIVCRESSGAPSNRGLFVSLKRRPGSEMEATEIARAIAAAATAPDIRTLEGGPFGGRPLLIGEERLGEVVDAPLSKDDPWSAIGIADFSVAQAAYQLTRGNIWLPQMQANEAAAIPVATVGRLAELGKGDAVIVGREGKAAFDLIKPPSPVATHPMLWSHDANRERCLIVGPDGEGRIRPGMEELAAEIWGTRSHAHHNRDFRFNSQSLAAAFTENRSIGGRAWPNVRFDERAHEVAYTLWCNTTLGLLCYWWHSSRQQAGRGSMPISAIRTMPTLDVTKLSQAQLEEAEAVFEDTRDRKFLPANQAYDDPSRKELDYRVLIDVLGLPKSVLEPLDLLRLKWCSEPSVHGGKSTAPTFR